MVIPLAFVSKAQGKVTFIIIVAIVKPSLFLKHVLALIQKQ